MAIREKDPELCKATNNNGSTIAHFAAHEGHTDTLMTIREKDPELCKKTNNYGTTIAHYAAGNGRTDTLMAIREKDPELYKATNNNGDTIAHEAAHGGHTDTLMAIREKDPELCKKNNNYGNTIAHEAAANGRTDTLMAISEHTPEMLSAQTTEAYYYPEIHTRIDIPAGSTPLDMMTIVNAKLQNIYSEEDFSNVRRAQLTGFIVNLDWDNAKKLMAEGVPIDIERISAIMKSDDHYIGTIEECRAFDSSLKKLIDYQDNYANMEEVASIFDTPIAVQTSTNINHQSLVGLQKALQPYREGNLQQVAVERFLNRLTNPAFYADVTQAIQTICDFLASMGKYGYEQTAEEAELKGEIPTTRLAEEIWKNRIPTKFKLDDKGAPHKSFEALIQHQIAKGLEGASTISPGQASLPQGRQ